jgi:hypothetical protein
MKMQLRPIIHLLPLAGLLALASPASAAVLSTGNATVDYDQAVWSALLFSAAPFDEFFDQAAANARTGSQINTDEVMANPSFLGQIFAMNGPTVSNLAGRSTQATTFSFDPAGSLSAHTGVIGLGGVNRFNTISGDLAIGDFTLLYDASRLLAGGSGWVLNNNFAFPVAAFDLISPIVSINIPANTISISGDLGLSPEVAIGILSNPAAAGTDVGNFSFTANYVPEPSSALFLLGALAPLAARRRRRSA